MAVLIEGTMVAGVISYVAREVHRTIRYRLSCSARLRQYVELNDPTA